MAAKAPVKKNMSALKRVRQDEKRSLRNQSKTAEIKTCVKKLEVSLPGKEKETIATALKKAVKTLSSAASKGIIHKNTAARKISRITKKANAAIA
ncbi:MAG TPA: 30S ribosomal protein S20 [Dissulfurispiraceae bacterium]|nr:30S ribosomal protein S20 [Dissulfurispiraceae bacterium]